LHEGELDMSILKPLRLFGVATLLSVSAVTAWAQTSPQAPTSPPAEKPPMAKPEAQQTTPSAPSKPSTSKPAHPLIGLKALSSDGNKAGDVRAVKTGPDGKVTAIQIKVGGFLGFGGKIVEVADGKFTQKGDTIQLAYTSEELSKLPEAKDAS
jgi:hypothetical protein